jgi:hypothetical protein
MALEDANIIIHQIEDFITEKIWEWYFWDILSTSTTVIWQSEYTLPVISSWSFNWVPKIESISIKYQDEYIKAREVNRVNLDQDLSYYETAQSTYDPFYFIADNSYFIYPAPLTAITNWIKLYWIKSLADITASTDETLIFAWKIQPKYFYAITDWMKQYILSRQWKSREWERAKQVFEKETLINLINKIGNRKTWISIIQEWDLPR